MSVREGLEFETEIASDTAPLDGPVAAIFAAPKMSTGCAIPRGAVTSVHRDMLSGEQPPRIG